MNIVQLYQDFSVETAPEGHKHYQNGWANVSCCYCEGNPGFHLGYNLNSDFFHCFRCGGGKPITKTLALILNKKETEVREIVKQYDFTIKREASAKKVTVGIKTLKFPTGTGQLLKGHINYLKSRNFDPEYLIKTWGLLATGPISRLEGRDYKNRIIIPFEWEGKFVTFDSRSISLHESWQQRYKACPKEFEVIPHKSILYGKQEHWREKGICVEGPTDVWRFGVNSFATSGIKYTTEQVRNMAKAFKRIAVVFDSDPQAIVQSHKLVAELKFRGVDAFRVDIEGDPGSMKQEDADYLVKTINNLKL